MTKKPNMRLRSRSEDYERNLDHYYDYLEAKWEDEEQEHRMQCSCEWINYRVTQVCEACISIGYAPVCKCVWRDLRNRSYKTQHCVDCQPKDHLAGNIWRKQIRAVRKKLAAADAAAPLSKKRFSCVHRLFSYIYKEEAFVRSNSSFRLVVLNKAREFRDQEFAAPLFSILDQVIDFYRI